jgi:AsmA protein
MRTFIKIAAIVTAAAFLITIAVAIFARIIITPERVREAVLPVAQKALNRDVQLGDISIRFFSGIILHDLRIMEPDGNEVFLSTEQAALRYRFLPLLSLQIVIDEIRIDEPRIRVVRLPDGTFNFSDLIADNDAGPAAAPALPRQDPVSDAGGVPVSLTVSAVRLNNGHILFNDAALNPDTPLQYQITRLNIATSSITLDNAFPFKLECRINNAPLSLEGHADMGTRSASARINVQNLDATAFLPYAADTLPGRLNSLIINLNARVEGSINQATAAGTLSLRDIDLVLDDLAEAPIRGAFASIDFDMSADMQTSTLDLRSMRVNLNGIVAETVGSIVNFDSEPSLALNITLPETPISTALAALPPALATDLLTMNPTGFITAQARLAGIPDSPAVLKDARIRLRDVEATTGGMRPGLNGSLLLTGDRIVSQDLIVTAAGNRAHIDLQAENLFDKPIHASAHISADHFDIDALLQPTASSARKTSPQKPETAVSAEEIGPFDLPVHANGCVKIAQAVYRGLTINDFNLTYRLADNVLTVEDMRGSIAGGTFNQSARIDLGRRGLAYKSTLSMQGVQADPVVSAFIPDMQGTVFGTLNLTLDADGTGTLPETLKKNLTCSTRMDLNDGRITGSGIARGLSDFLKLDELRELRFNTFGGTVNIKQGQAHLATEFNSTDVRMQPQGNIGLDGSLDLSLNAALGPVLMQKIDRRGHIASFFTDQQGWGRLPLKVKGSLDQPRFTLDTTGVRQQVEEKIIDTLQQRLLERTAPKQPPAEIPDTESPQEIQEETPPVSEQQADQETRQQRRQRKKEEKREDRRQAIEGILDDVLSR